ncbi:hypothetical protein BY996DRAFT_6483122 [Phakopsora pachyrhizi]|uniref:Uncharacterized protein n=1 Tax=Phakopsora pachyrhizi TaxID=170000 RepID=A0AAV0AEJ8_PHAPC|nr:hypothetical protein BY996DRAFT_6483122 [Phakopsora pachyrhizi]CAH7665826.1 hypothetical protein PPACK8108_LOCUS114 [Phakopsora pachyrhizi]
MSPGAFPQGSQLLDGRAGLGPRAWLGYAGLLQTICYGKLFDRNRRLPHNAQNALDYSEYCQAAFGYKWEHFTFEGRSEGGGSQKRHFELTLREFSRL